MPMMQRDWLSTCDWPTITRKQTRHIRSPNSIPRQSLPQARLTVESSLAAYETGGVDFLSILNNQTAALDYEMDYHEQMLNYHLAITRMEEVTGMDLMAGGH